MSDQAKKRRLSTEGPSTEQSDKPGETLPVAVSTLILLPTKQELDRVLFLVYEKEKYKKAIELADRELKELSKKPELASLARSYSAALSGNRKRPSSSPSVKETKEIKEENKDGKEKKIENKEVLQLPLPIQSPAKKKTPSQKRREKEKKKKAEEKKAREEDRAKIAALSRLDPSSPFSNLLLSPLGSNHPMENPTKAQSSSSSSSSSSSTLGSNMST
jgi:hypothetical protein